MRLKYKGKNAVVTGACGGIGLECVKKLQKTGLKVLMLDIKEPPLNFLNKFKSVTFYKIDVTNFSKLKKIINKYYNKNKSIDYLINRLKKPFWFSEFKFHTFDKEFFGGSSEPKQFS